MIGFRKYLRSIKDRPLVRPWALCVPIAVLLVCLPLLRPLRHPDPLKASDTETSRLATVQAIVEHHTLAIDEGSFIYTRDKFHLGQCTYSDQPPVFAALLAGPYWVMRQAGLSFDSNPILVAYLLTVIGVTLPVALSAGLLYRMGRLFQLSRPWRAGLAAAVVFGSGLVSYGVVLNAHAPAAALVLAAAACLIHVIISKKPEYNTSWLMVAGLCAATAAVIDLPASIFLLLLFFVIPALRWPLSRRAVGMALYIAGALPVIALHAKLTRPLTGDLFPPVMHPELSARTTEAKTAGPELTAFAAPLSTIGMDRESAAAPSRWASIIHPANRILQTLVGPHGIFSHFPVLLFALLGVGAIMHRHWPAATKALALVTVFGSTVVLVVCALWRVDWVHAMFAARWFIVFLPLLAFWGGAWLRRRHHPLVWTMAAAFLAFSVGVSLIGATNPFPRDGYRGYTVANSFDNLFHVQPLPAPGQIASGGGAL